MPAIYNIADIFDRGEKGRMAKQFEGLYYTKDRSLVFYCLDLVRRVAANWSARKQYMLPKLEDIAWSREASSNLWILSLCPESSLCVIS